MTSSFPESIRFIIVASLVAGMAVFIFGATEYAIQHNNINSAVVSAQRDESILPTQSEADITKLMGQLQKNNNDPQILFQLGKTFFEVQEFPRAASFFSRAMVSAPSDPAPRYWLGVTMYQQGKYKEAADLLEGVLSKERMPDAMYNLSIIYAYHLENKEKAKVLLEEIIAMPNNKSSLVTKAKQTLENLP